MATTVGVPANNNNVHSDLFSGSETIAQAPNPPEEQPSYPDPGEEPSYDPKETPKPPKK